MDHLIVLLQTDRQIFPLAPPSALSFALFEGDKQISVSFELEQWIPCSALTPASYTHPHLLACAQAWGLTTFPVELTALYFPYGTIPTSHTGEEGRGTLPPSLRIPRSEQNPAAELAWHTLLFTHALGDAFGGP